MNLEDECNCILTYKYFDEVLNSCELCDDKCKVLHILKTDKINSIFFQFYDFYLKFHLIFKLYNVLNRLAQTLQFFV